MAISQLLINRFSNLRLIWSDHLVKKVLTSWTLKTLNLRVLNALKPIKETSFAVRSILDVTSKTIQEVTSKKPLCRQCGLHAVKATSSHLPQFHSTDHSPDLSSWRPAGLQINDLITMMPTTCWNLQQTTRSRSVRNHRWGIFSKKSSLRMLLGEESQLSFFVFGNFGEMFEKCSRERDIRRICSRGSQNVEDSQPLWSSSSLCNSLRSRRLKTGQFIEQRFDEHAAAWTRPSFVVHSVNGAFKPETIGNRPISNRWGLNKRHRTCSGLRFGNTFNIFIQENMRETMSTMWTPHLMTLPYGSTVFTVLYLHNLLSSLKLLTTYGSPMTNRQPYHLLKFIYKRRLISDLSETVWLKKVLLEPHKTTWNWIVENQFRNSVFLPEQAETLSHWNFSHKFSGRSSSVAIFTRRPTNQIIQINEIISSLFRLSPIEDLRYSLTRVELF